MAGPDEGSVNYLDALLRSPSCCSGTPPPSTPSSGNLPSSTASSSLANRSSSHRSSVTSKPPEQMSVGRHRWFTVQESPKPQPPCVSPASPFLVSYNPSATPATWNAYNPSTTPAARNARENARSPATCSYASFLPSPLPESTTPATCSYLQQQQQSPHKKRTSRRTPVASSCTAADHPLIPAARSAKSATRKSNVVLSPSLPVCSSSSSCTGCSVHMRQIVRFHPASPWQRSPSPGCGVARRPGRRRPISPAQPLEKLHHGSETVLNEMRGSAASSPEVQAASEGLVGPPLLLEEEGLFEITRTGLARPSSPAWSKQQRVTSLSPPLPPPSLSDSDSSFSSLPVSPPPAPPSSPFTELPSTTPPPPVYYPPPPYPLSPAPVFASDSVTPFSPPPPPPLSSPPASLHKPSASPGFSDLYLSPASSLSSFRKLSSSPLSRRVSSPAPPSSSSPPPPPPPSDSPLHDSPPPPPAQLPIPIRLTFQTQQQPVFVEETDSGGGQIGGGQGRPLLLLQAWNTLLQLQSKAKAGSRTGSRCSSPIRQEQLIDPVAVTDSLPVVTQSVSVGRIEACKGPQGLMQDQKHAKDRTGRQHLQEGAESKVDIWVRRPPWRLPDCLDAHELAKFRLMLAQHRAPATGLENVKSPPANKTQGNGLAFLPEGVIKLPCQLSKLLKPDCCGGGQILTHVSARLHGVLQALQLLQLYRASLTSRSDAVSPSSPAVVSNIPVGGGGVTRPKSRGRRGSLKEHFRRATMQFSEASIFVEGVSQQLWQSGGSSNWSSSSSRGRAGCATCLVGVGRPSWGLGSGGDFVTVVQHSLKEIPCSDITGGTPGDVEAAMTHDTGFTLPAKTLFNRDYQKQVENMASSEQYEKAQLDNYGFPLAKELTSVYSEWLYGKYQNSLQGQKLLWQHGSGQCLKQSQLSPLSWHGFPAAVRARAWWQSFRAGPVREEELRRRGLALGDKGDEYPFRAYCTMLETQQQKTIAEGDVKVEGAHSSLRKLITLDVRRMFPGHEGFRRTAMSTAMTRMLITFQLLFTKQPYNQAMSYLAAWLLLVFTGGEDVTSDVDQQHVLPGEARAFWVFVTLVQYVLPAGYLDGAGATADVAAFEVLLAARAPSLYAHLLQLRVDVSLLVLPWFMCCFVSVLLPPETVLRLWDVMAVEGRTTLFRFALAVFVSHQEEIMALSDGCAVMALLSRPGPKLLDCDGLAEVARFKCDFAVESLVPLLLAARVCVDAASSCTSILIPSSPSSSPLLFSPSSSLSLSSRFPSSNSHDLSSSTSEAVKGSTHIQPTPESNSYAEINRAKTEQPGTKQTALGPSSEKAGG
eukprot:gb/GEZN01000478.1/.p1 GENE.gb/GEZN01000478.1/~~gb/GEZN01000478.1/.p1  ORF type:complete len:1321 (-),score=202.29 gb/GEZN01000478.1/:339-4301(-)